MRSEIHNSTIDLGEMLDGGSEDRVLWVLGKGAVGRSREPGKTMLDGGIWTAAVAMFPFFSLFSFLFPLSSFLFPLSSFLFPLSSFFFLLFSFFLLTFGSAFCSRPLLVLTRGEIMNS